MAEQPIKPNDRRGIDSPPNRALEMRRDNDVFKTPSINIYDIDYAILYHLQNNFALTLIDNGVTIKVPVMYGNGEKWSQIQEHGFLRDASSKQIVPLIVLHRTSMEHDSRISQLDVQNNFSNANFPMHVKILPQRTTRPGHDHFSKVYNADKPEEYYLMAIPSFVSVVYDVIIWTDYIEQMNHIIMQLEPADGQAWGETWQFPTRISGYTFETVSSDSEDRIVKCNLTLTVEGILLNEFEGKISTIQKAHSLKRVVFENERSEFAGYVDNLPEDLYPSDATLYKQYQNIINSRFK